MQRLRWRLLTSTTALLVALPLGLTASGSSAQAAPAERRPASGHYVGTEVPEQPNGFDDIVFNFDVRTKGRRTTIRKFTIAMNVVCSGYPLYTDYVVQPMHTMRVNPRTGRFRDVVRGTTDGGTTYRVAVAGILRGKKVKRGTMSYDVGVCQRGTGDDGPVRWVARKGRR